MKKVKCFKNNEIVGVFYTIDEASEATGVSVGDIKRCLYGKMDSSDGYEFHWFYDFGSYNTSKLPW